MPNYSRNSGYYGTKGEVLSAPLSAEQAQGLAEILRALRYEEVGLGLHLIATIHLTVEPEGFAFVALRTADGGLVQLVDERGFVQILRRGLADATRMGFLAIHDEGSQYTKVHNQKKPMYAHKYVREGRVFVHHYREKSGNWVVDEAWEDELV